MPSEPTANEPATSGNESIPETGERKKRLSVIESASLVGVAAILLAAAWYFTGLSSGGEQEADDSPVAAAEISTPVEGERVSITSLETYWRERRPTDRVTPDQNLLPEIRLEVEPFGAGGSSYLKLHFLDPEGKIVGDVRTARFEGGKFIDSRRGEDILSDRVCAASATKGIQDDTTFIAYRFSDEDRWTVEVYEGADYSEGPWQRIAFVEVDNRILEGSGDASDG